VDGALVRSVRFYLPKIAMFSIRKGVEMARNSAIAVVLALTSATVACHNTGASPSSQDTLLEAGVNETARGEHEGADYDGWKTFSAAAILPPELLGSEHHQVSDIVVLYGPQLFFEVKSDFGTFEARGKSMLRRRVAEVHAIAGLVELAGTEGYATGVKKSLLSPFAAVKALVLHPVDTVTGIPEGVYAFGLESVEETKGGRSDTEDRLAGALLGLSKYKRQLADKFEVDVYSENKVLQREMNRIGWAAVAGDWTPTILLLPVSGTGKVIYSAFDWTYTFNDLLVQQSPDALRVHNRKILDALGIDKDLVTNFLHNLTLTPRNATVITGACHTMREVDSLEVVLQQALISNSHYDSFYYQQVVEILASYHRTQGGLEKLIVFRGMPVGLANNGTLIIALPGDYSRWTVFSERLMKELVELSISELGPQAKTAIWLTGRASPLAKERVAEMSIELVDNIDEQITLVY